MKHLIFILFILQALSFSFYDKIGIIFNYTGFEKASASEMRNSNIPVPEHTNYLVDKENILNGATQEILALNVYPMDKDSMRHMDYYDPPYRRPFDPYRDYPVFKQFKRLDSSWIEMKDGRLVITVWPQKKLGEEWCTSLVLTGDSGETWDSLEVPSNGDYNFVGSTFTFKHKIYNGTEPFVAPYVAVGTAYIRVSILYDREAYADSIKAYEDSVIAYADSIKAYDDSVIAYADSIKAYEDSVLAYADSIKAYDDSVLAYADSIKAYEDSVIAYADSIKAYEDSVLAYADSVRIADSLEAVTIVILPSRKEEAFGGGVLYDLLGRRNGVATRENLICVKRRHSR